MQNKIKQYFNQFVKKDKISMLKRLFPFCILLLFSLGCHLYIFWGGKLFGQMNSDNCSQFMYFVTFLHKSFKSGQFFWSWSYGLGGDIFGEFTYYYTTSPFFYLMFILRKLGIGTLTLGGTVHWRLIFSIFRQFLAMSILYFLLKYEKKSTYTSLIGAAIYGGCISFIWFSLSFDFMADAYVWLPLTILGWRTYEKTKKCCLFVISVAVTIANSFYFGFISCVFYTIFAIVFINVEGSTIREKIHSFFSNILRYSLFVIMALGLAAPAFIPSVLSFLKTDRFSTVVKIPIFCGKDYILTLPEKLFSYANVLGFPLIILIIFTLPWKRISSITKRKTILVGIFFIMYLTPYSGSFFNGFSYSSDRWVYLFIFSVAYAVPNWLEEDDRLKRVGFCFLSVITILTICCYHLKQARIFKYMMIHNEKTTNVINIIILSMGVLSFLALMLKKHIVKKSINVILNYSIVLCVMVSLMGNSNCYMAIALPDMTQELLTNSCMENEEEQKIFSKLIPSKNEFYRTIFANLPQENAPMNYGYYGTSAYNSMIDGNLHRWLKVDHNILHPFVTPSSYRNFDDRLFLETFFGSKYIVNNKNDFNCVPYGYSIVKQTDNYNVCKNKYNVGFDLWYSSTMDRNAYNNMNVAQKDSILLQTAVVDKNVLELSRPLVDNATSELLLDWSNATKENMEYKDGILKAKKDAVINIPIKNNKKNISGEILFSMNLKPLDGRAFKLNVNGKSTAKSEEVYPYVYPIYQYTFRLDGNTDILKLNISEGEYKISNTYVWFNSYEFYKNWVKERNKYNMENLYVDGRKVKGKINNNEKGIMAFNIPFNKGWSAKVDGKKQELINVNGILTGLVLEPGSHDVEFEYITPGFLIGNFISIIMILCIIIFHILNKRKKNIRDNVINIEL